jgi:2-polyprenyl-3-methyl-5-hydroxy-6-metoxy-1,4-benzoquinol methylase
LDFFEKYKSKEDKYSSHQLLKNQILNSSFLSPRIIDFGCYRGELLNSLGKLLPGSDLFGSDIENFVPQDYKKINLLIMDLNDINQLKKLEENKFDVIILADILEHILNPEDMLKKMHNFRTLKSNIFLSIPNSGHWYFRLKVFFGKFDYAENGLFDKTHIRFFTLKTIRELILNCNFEIIDLDYSSIPWENITTIRIIRKNFSKIERLLIKLRPEIFAYQVVCKLN